jgi:hypothetical protein
MGTNYGPEDPTYYSANYLATPLSNHISTKLHFETKTILGPQASKKQFP